MSTAQRSSLRTDELDYELPEGLIATRPAEPRDSARMLVVHRSDEVIEHRCVRDLPEYLAAGDALVFNTTAVMPARLLGRRIDTGGKVEGLYLHEETPTGSAETEGRPRWRVMLRAGGRLVSGQRIELVDHNHQPSGVVLELVEKQSGGEWIAELASGHKTSTALDAVGWTPLPPYILHARHGQAFADDDDRRWYQTVFADQSKRQSVAAPTAGLHFTAELMEAVRARGVERVDVTLHVGAGTFKPITAATLAEHRMHSEWFEVSPQAVAALRRVRRAAMAGEPAGRIIAIGTTSVRTLESLPDPLPDPAQMCGPIHGLTDLLIAPPYRFRHVDGMLTNFHLPRSTLLALVAAMIGLDRLKAVYREAIDRGYRFYSYGDAMLILP